MEIKNLKTNWKPVKVNNAIVIGGMTAFGKSTLSKEIIKLLDNAQIVEELNMDDNLTHTLFEKKYEMKNNNLFASVFQLFSILNRFNKYEIHTNSNQLSIFDRSIFEDWLFAHENIIRPSVFWEYQRMWKDICHQLIESCGVPLLYVVLVGDWKLFKERLYLRNRRTEIDNFNQNEFFFKRMLSIYQDFLVNACKDFGIDYLIVDAYLPLETKTKLVVDKVNELLENK